jgi:hypothetical protein
MTTIITWVMRIRLNSMTIMLEILISIIDNKVHGQ